MKSLNDIDAHVSAAGEKRIPLSGVTVISQPGSFYLTKNINAPAGTSGLQIAASDVTIDLNGFSIIGQGTSGTPAGIAVQGTRSNICVKNGTITGFHGRGISGDISNSRFEKLIINGNHGYGLNLTDNNEVSDCVITNNSLVGINMGSGCRVVQSIVSANGGGIFGLDQTTVESCTFAANGGEGVFVNFGGVVRNCTVRGNGGVGIFFSGGSQIVGNTVDANGDVGLITSGDASRVEGNTATYNHGQGFSFNGSVNLVVRNSARGNASGSVDDNYNKLQNSTANVFGHIIDMSAPGLIPDNFGAWSNISY
jgi:hypothetical protein